VLEITRQCENGPHASRTYVGTRTSGITDGRVRLRDCFANSGNPAAFTAHAGFKLAFFHRRTNHPHVVSETSEL
jgi:hypothetical protein